jgi:DNA (cytosine-5)-methyltransferase 1
MRHGSLFSGIGGFDLAAEWVGWENVFQVEWDDYCQKVLAKNFPNVKRYGDIKEFKGEHGSADIISGGFPCQPFSHAGKRKGEADDRYLWPEYLRVIREIQPTYVVGENVAGLVSMDDGKTLDGILSDLEGEGYETEQFIIPACGVGAWHRRDRIWIIGTLQDSLRVRCTSGQRESESNIRGQRESCSGDIQRIHRQKDVSDTDNQGLERLNEWRSSTLKTGPIKSDIRAENICNGGGYWSTESNVGRVANGIPRRMDRLKALGNSIVPQVAYEIFKTINTYHYERT